jgi:hypothetical protein
MFGMFFLQGGNTGRHPSVQLTSHKTQTFLLSNHNPQEMLEIFCDSDVILA